MLYHGTFFEHCTEAGSIADVSAVYLQLWAVSSAAVFQHLLHQWNIRPLHRLRPHRQHLSHHHRCSLWYARTHITHVIFCSLALCCCCKAVLQMLPTCKLVPALGCPCSWLSLLLAIQLLCLLMLFLMHLQRGVTPMMWVPLTLRTPLVLQLPGTKGLPSLPSGWKSTMSCRPSFLCKTLPTCSS